MKYWTKVFLSLLLFSGAFLMGLAMIKGNAFYFSGSCICYAVFIDILDGAIKKKA